MSIIFECVHYQAILEANEKIKGHKSKCPKCKKKIKIPEKSAFNNNMNKKDKGPGD